ncbi:MAG: hypothetical protein ABF258_06645 [Flavobacteriales bacterium]
MKKKLITIGLFLALITQSFSQIEYEKFSLITGLKAYDEFMDGDDTLSATSFEIGIGLRGGVDFNSILRSTSFFGFSGTSELFANWAYATPYASIEFIRGYNVEKEKGEKLRGGSNPVMINLGGSAGAGFNLFYLIPVGVGASAGLSSDFQDVFLTYSYGLSFRSISISYAGRTNWTGNKTAKVKTTNHIDIKYAYNLFKSDW